MRKTILSVIFISLSFPALAQYKIMFDNSNLELPEKPEVQSMLSFDGTNDYVDATNNVWNNHTTHTAELWFKRNNESSETTNHSVHNILLAKASADHNDNFELGTFGQNVEVYFDTSEEGGSIDTESFSANIQNDTWHHLSVTFNYGQVYVYLDGEQTGSYDWGAQMDASADSSPFAIGESQHEGAPFDGLIREVRVWDDVRTQTEIQNNMNEALTGNEAGLEAYYKMNSGSGLTAVDSAENNDGIINGATWIEK